MTANGGTNLRPLGIGEILDAALKVYRNHFRTLTTAVLVVVLPLSILDTLVTASTTENAFDYSGTATTDPDSSFLAGQLVSTLITILLNAVATAACFYAIMRGYLGESATWQESLRFGLKRMLPVIGLAVLATLGLIPMFLLLIIPGIWLAVRWSVATPALLAEDIGPAGALGRSFKLVGGRWWATFGALVAMTILITVLAVVVGFLMGVVFADPGNEVVVAIVYTLVIALAYAITLPIQSAVFTILYYDLRVRKEGYDLQMAAGSLGTAAPATPAYGETGGAFAPPTSDTGFSSSGGFSPPAPSEGGFAARPAEPEREVDTSRSVPPPGLGGDTRSGGLSIPTPAPAAPPVPEPEPEPTPAPASGFSAPDPDPEPTSSSGYGSTATPDPGPEPAGSAFGNTATPEPEPEPAGSAFGNTATPEPEPEPAGSAFGNTATPEPGPEPAGSAFGNTATPEPEPEPAGSAFGETVAPADPEPAAAPEPAEEPGLSWSPTPPDADDDEDTASPPPGGSPPASQ